MDIENLIQKSINGDLATKLELRELYEDPEATERLVNTIMERMSRLKVTQRLTQLHELEKRMENGGPAMLKVEMDELEYLTEMAWERGWDV